MYSQFACCPHCGELLDSSQLPRGRASRLVHCASKQNATELSSHELARAKATCKVARLIDNSPS